MRWSVYQIPKSARVCSIKKTGCRYHAPGTPVKFIKRGNRTTFVVLFLVLFGLGFLSFLLGGQPRGALLPFIGFHDSPRCPVGLVDGYHDAGLVRVEIVPLYKPVSP